MSASSAIECQICFSNYSATDNGKSPRVLVCGHTVCFKCASDMLEKTKTKSVQCPYDRKDTPAANGAEDLPKNFTILDLLERQLKETTVKEKVEVNSEQEMPCVEDSSHKSVWFCKNCSAEFCDSCFKKSHSMKVMANHQKVPVSEKPIQLPKCSSHPAYDAELFCVSSSCSSTNQKPFCQICALTDHKSHNFEKYEKYAECMLLKKKLINNLKEVEKIAKNYQGKFHKNSAEYEDKSRKIKQYFDLKRTAALKKLESDAGNKSQFIAKSIDKIGQVFSKNEKSGQTLLASDFQDMEGILKGLFVDLAKLEYNMDYYLS